MVRQQSVRVWSRFWEGFPLMLSPNRRKNRWRFGGNMNQNLRKINGKIARKGDASWRRFWRGFSLILSPHRRKIDGKIDRKSDASSNQFLEGFSLILSENREKSMAKSIEKTMVLEST